LLKSFVSMNVYTLVLYGYAVLRQGQRTGDLTFAISADAQAARRLLAETLRVPLAILASGVTTRDGRCIA
jgi:hypothetical protein